MAECVELLHQSQSQSLSPSSSSSSNTLVATSSPPQTSLSSTGKTGGFKEDTSPPNEFYPSETLCIFKSGPAWPTGREIDSQAIEREIRPVIGSHSIEPVWLSIAQAISMSLDSSGIIWSSIDPLAYANVNEIHPFCPLLLCIHVPPHSLSYDTAVSAAVPIKKILSANGFPEIEVAFFESILTRQAAGPRFPSVHNFKDVVPNLRKPFTSALGLSISPAKLPHCEGTAGLYFRMGSDTSTICVLTCAHVACPPKHSINATVTNKPPSQPRKAIMLLGDQSYTTAINNIKKSIAAQASKAKDKARALASFGPFVEGEGESVSWLRTLIEKERDVATALALWSKALLDKVAKYRSPESRSIGFVYHSQEIGVGTTPDNYTNDWALIELDSNALDLTVFQGNKMYIADGHDFKTTMYPQASDSSSYHSPGGVFLQAFGTVQDAELRNPQQLDANADPSLLVVKNGSATGTTFGQVNGLLSIERVYSGIGLMEESLELTIIPHREESRGFSAPGDSGAIVLDRNGRIVGMITGGRGSTNRTDVTYVTPYWWLEKQIKEKFPGCFLYEVVS